VVSSFFDLLLVHTMYSLSIQRNEKEEKKHDTRIPNLTRFTTDRTPRAKSRSVLRLILSLAAILWLLHLFTYYLMASLCIQVLYFANFSL
jgi:hypothetical protein